MSSTDNKIKYAELASALLDRASTLLPAWVPGGTLHGKEYTALSPWRHEKTASFSVSISGSTAGKWSDFGGTHKGGDLLSLYAALQGMSMHDAAIEVARNEGLEDVANVRRDAAYTPPVRAVPVKALEMPKPDRQTEKWQVICPVPAGAVPFKFRHWHYAEDAVQHVAEYAVDGVLYGYVVRVGKSDGGKIPLPYVWAESEVDGTRKWVNKSMPVPRVLYLPNGKSPAKYGATLPTVVVVEGEAKADVLQALLDAIAPNVYLVAGWCGGSKAWAKADWSLLAGCTVLLWPDCDGKRTQPTREQLAACETEDGRQCLQAMQQVLPECEQVGMVAMVGIGAQLREAHGCTVSLLPIPKPLEVVDGWDCRDAIEVDGWDGERVLKFFAGAYALPAGAAAAPAAGVGAQSPHRDGPADAGQSDDEFRKYLNGLKGGASGAQVTREVVIQALRMAPDLCGCLGFNELSNAPSARVPFPWRDQAGHLSDRDDLALGDWLSKEYGLRAAPRGALSEAIETVADSRRFHPIRDWLSASVWDGKSRIDKWLIHVLGMDIDALAPKRRRYLELVGRFILMGLVARVMEPGCKFDYSPVFEGPGGIGKSTLVKTLVGAEFFSDTHFDVGSGKDGMEQLEGLWGYELSELTALRKADSEQVKQFFSSCIDRFRGAYGKYVQAHPRQCVIFCSTNKKQYLYDLTGNRRFWPIWIDQRIKLEWLSKFREQLFAEAFLLYNAGEAYAPTREQEEEFFVPEQKLRLVETAVQSRLFELLTRARVSKGESIRSVVFTVESSFVTLDGLVEALGADAAKSSSLLESQIRAWLDAQGWTYGRESTGVRRRGYKRPAVWPPKIEDDDVAQQAQLGSSDRDTYPNEDESDDDVPF